MIKPTGNPSARILIIGDQPSSDDERTGTAFSGGRGWELDKMLKEAGLDRSQCFTTLVCQRRAFKGNLAEYIAFTKKAITPAHVQFHGRWMLPCMLDWIQKFYKEIELIKPDIILCLGNLGLWILTDKWGVASWRGSMFYNNNMPTPSGKIKVMSTYSPEVLYGQWELRPVIVQDFRRVKQYLEKPWPSVVHNFEIRPSFESACWRLAELTTLLDARATTLSVDIETRCYNIACLGIAWTKHDAICIPLMEIGKNEGYWSESEEGEIIFLLYKLLTHPNARIVGQNFIYDAQYISRFWHFIPGFARDTMLAHHVLFPTMQKSLDFICSMHNEEYVFWKDDGKTLALDGDEDKHWTYNCEDCVRTFEADESLQECVDQLAVRGPHDFQMSLFKPVLKMMNRGVKVDREYQLMLVKQLNGLAKELLEDIEFIVGYPLNPRSSVQMKKFFYEEMKQPRQLKRTADGMVVSCDSASLEKVVTREPLLKPVVERIEEWRSVQVFLSNFLADKRDKDGRLRCAFNIGGTYTFRFSSSENAFGSGLNLQNIPGDDKS